MSNKALSEEALKAQAVKKFTEELKARASIASTLAESALFAEPTGAEYLTAEREKVAALLAVESLPSGVQTYLRFLHDELLDDSKRMGAFYAAAPSAQVAQLYTDTFGSQAQQPLERLKDRVVKMDTTAA